MIEIAEMIMWVLLGALGALIGLIVLLVIVFLVFKTATLAILWGKLRFSQRQLKEMEKDGKQGKT